MGISLLQIRSGSRVARHTRRRAKVLGEDTVLCYLFCLVSGILPSDVRHGLLIKRTAEAKDLPTETV